MYILYTYPDFWLKGNKRERPSFERPYTFSVSVSYMVRVFNYPGVDRHDKDTQ